MRFAAYCERRATHIRKLMMIVSASRSNDLVIEREDFDRARKILTTAEIKMGWTFGGLGRARNSDAQERIMEYLRKVGVSTRSSLLTKFYRDVDSETMRSIEMTMEEMKVIEITFKVGSQEKVYRWIGK